MRAVRELFLSDQLGQVSPLARLLYIGLHLLTDDLDQVPYRPMWIKAQLLPYDKGDSDDAVILLDELREEELIKYVGEDGETIQLLPYWKHEAVPKKLKPVPADNKTARPNSKSSTPNNTKKKGKPVRGRTSAVYDWVNDPEKRRQLQEWVAQGLKPTELIARIGIAPGTFYYWRSTTPEFLALLEPKEDAEPEANEEDTTELEPKKKLHGRKFDANTIVFKRPETGVSQPITTTEQEVTVTVLPSVKEPEPQKEPPGYQVWLEDPVKANQIRVWAADGRSTLDIANRMGVLLEKLVQWKVMSTEFAALFMVEPKKRRSLSELI